MATAASEAQTVCLVEAELLEQVEVVAAVVKRLPLHIDAFDDRDELVSSIAVPARQKHQISRCRDDRPVIGCGSDCDPSAAAKVEQTTSHSAESTRGFAPPTPVLTSPTPGMTSGGCLPLRGSRLVCSTQASSGRCSTWATG